MKSRSGLRGFSLVELVIVVVILGIIAAIAVPRISRGAKGAGDSSLRASLAGFRNAIDMYAAEHGGTFATVAQITAGNLTSKTNFGGTIGTTDGEHIYGPYLRTMPALPVDGEGATAGKKDDTTVAATAAVDVAWVYDEDTGVLTANTGTAEDDSGTLYTAY